MKKINFLLSVLIVAGFAISFYSCDKDDLTEKERLELLDSLNNNAIVQYSVNVISAADAGILKSGKDVKGLSGAVVTVNRAGKLISSTTNDYGMAVFKDLRGSNLTVTIAMDGYTDVAYVANLTPEVAQNQNYTFASTMVPLFPLSGEWMTDVTGVVTYQSDLTNNTREKAEGVTVTATLDIDNDFMNTFFPNNEGPGHVVQVSYSSILMKTETDANGEYSLTIPAAAQGLDVMVDVAEVAEDQKLVLTILNGEPVTGTQTIRTIFGNAGVAPSSVPDIPGAYVTIGAPTGAIGSYIQQASFANAVITDGEITSIAVNIPGSGYTAAPDVIISGNGTGATATASLGADGAVVSITVTNGGSEYTYASASPYITIYRENAEATTNITSGGAVSSITLQNGGEGYIVPPNVTINSQTSEGSGATAVIYSSNISGGSINNITITNGGSIYRQHANYPQNAENSTIPVNGLNVKAYSGKPMIRDLYLGTGQRSIVY
ncbi:MAG: hypothetical protein K8S16_16460 [Bacteroidales bacterium]|nr:hypothetical protein [Bacteroidales bacterium]